MRHEAGGPQPSAAIHSSRMRRRSSAAAIPKVYCSSGDDGGEISNQRGRGHDTVMIIDIDILCILKNHNGEMHKMYYASEKPLKTF